MSLPRPTLEARYFVRSYLFDASQEPAQFVIVNDIKSDSYLEELGDLISCHASANVRSQHKLQIWHPGCHMRFK